MNKLNINPTAERLVILELKNARNKRGEPSRFFVLQFDR